MVPLRVQVHQLHRLTAPHCGPRARVCAAKEAGQAGGEAVLRNLNHRGRLDHPVAHELTLLVETTALPAASPVSGPLLAGDGASPGNILR